MKTIWLNVLAIGFIVVNASGLQPLLAHHSHAMFNGNVETEISGTLTNVRFANPHVYLRIDATHRDGKPLPEKQTWAIELPTTGKMPLTMPILTNA